MAKGGSGGGAGNEVSLPPPSGTEESFSQWSLERDPTPAVSAAAPSSAAAGIVPHLQVHRTSQPSRVRGATTNIIQQQGIHISVSSERTSGGPPCGEAAPSPHSARRKKTGLRFSDLQTDLRTGTISRRRGEQTQVVVGNYGAFGVVYKAMNMETDELVAIKRMKKEDMNEKALRSLMSEVDILKQCRHEYMMRYIQLIESEYHINMVLEFVGGGSLLQRLRRCRTFPEMLAAFWTRQLLCTLMYLHSLGIVHRDIKAANIMITEDAVVKLGDFGIALGVEEASGGDADSMAEGSPYWMAPEVIEMQPPGTPSDIWSVACFVIELITGDPPYFELPSISALFRIVQDDMPPLPSASERCLDFLRACFARDPAQRPTAQVLLSHPFIEQVRDLDQCGAQCMLDELTSQQSLTGSDGSRRNSVCEEDMDALPPSPLTPRSRASTSMIPSSSLSTGRSVASLTRHYDAMPESSGTQSMVLVSGFETRRTKALSYTVFRLRVQRGTQKWSVFKTFSDFRDFFNRLKRELKTRRIKVKLPEFPPQKMFGAEKAGYLKKRRVQLNDFLDALNCLRPVTRTELLDDFLARDGEDAASHVSDDRTHTVVTSFHVDDASAADQ